jgi:crotonobetaine/carnitine-CoA ligase
VAIAEDAEILVRCDESGLMTLGYQGMPEATAEAFRDGWFHTGDLGRLDADGWLYFLGRKKDAIRRRGENISAFEIEEVIEAHPAVLQAAAFGVPSELMEEEVKVCVVLKPGGRLAPAELLDWCRDRMARHMLPRYLEFLDSLPLTPTAKVEKYRLREAGITPGTWDAQQVARAS